MCARTRLPVCSTFRCLFVAHIVNQFVVESILFISTLLALYGHPYASAVIHLFDNELVLLWLTRKSLLSQISATIGF